MVTLADLDEVLVEAQARSADMQKKFEEKFYSGGVRVAATKMSARQPELVRGLEPRTREMVQRRLQWLQAGGE